MMKSLRPKKSIINPLLGLHKGHPAVLAILKSSLTLKKWSFGSFWHPFLVVFWPSSLTNCADFAGFACCEKTVLLMSRHKRPSILSFKMAFRRCQGPKKWWWWTFIWFHAIIIHSTWLNWLQTELSCCKQRLAGKTCPIQSHIII